MAEIIKEIKNEEKKVEKALKKYKINSWMIVSAVLVVVLIIVFIMQGGLGSSGSMSKDAAGAKLVNFLNTYVVSGGGVTLNNVTEKGQLYEVNVLYKGQDIPVYTTRDGNYFIQGATEIAAASKQAASSSGSNTPAAEVPKSDKPEVDAFVFAYCPYGLQFEKALLPVYSLLKDKADINIVYIGAMHGDFEKVESYRQLCVQKLYGKDKLFQYLDKFDTNTAIGSCSGSDTCLSPLLSTLMTSIGIDKAKVDACMASDAEALYNSDGTKAQSLGISGSPTFVINGVQASVGRTPLAIQTAICNAFNTAPSECSQNLSATAASSGFGGATGASTGASCG